jgi:hypothetical protein
VLADGAALEPLPPEAAPAMAAPPSARAAIETTIRAVFLSLSVILVLSVGYTDSPKETSGT